MPDKKKKPGKKKKEKEKCIYESGEYVIGDYKCGRDALPGDKHCIFHSQNIEAKKDTFNDAFLEGV